MQSIPSTLAAEDFSLHLLASLNTCSTSHRIKILAALQALHSRGLLPDSRKLYQGLTDLVPLLVRQNMVLYVYVKDWHFNNFIMSWEPVFLCVFQTPLDRRAVVEMLKLLLSIRSPCSDLMKKLLTLLACKKLGLR